MSWNTRHNFHLQNMNTLPYIFTYSLGNTCQTSHSETSTFLGAGIKVVNTVDRFCSQRLCSCKKRHMTNTHKKIHYQGQLLFGKLGILLVAE